MRYPLDDFTISQGFGPNHQAIDMAAPAGTPVFAPVNGTVIGMGLDPNYLGGLYLIIREDGPDKFEHYTGHHSSLLVMRGSHVNEGDRIALVGQTGPTSGPNKPTGPHVHYQIRRANAGELLNPQDVFKAREDNYMGKTAEQWAKDAEYATGVANERARLLKIAQQERDTATDIAEARDKFLRQVAKALGKDYKTIDSKEIAEMVGLIWAGSDGKLAEAKNLAKKIGEL